MENAFGQTTTKAVEAKPQAESLMIPKHRFDCINLCLKETKQVLVNKTAEVQAVQARISELEKLLLDAKAESVIALHKAKNLTAVKALIDFSGLRLEQDGTVPGLEEQVLRIKNSQSYLFENEKNAAYVLIPVNDGDPLNKTITNYVKRYRRIEK